MHSSYISKEIDEYISNLDSTIWIAKLSDGTFAYQDDGRPGYSISSWCRLKNYCVENNVKVIGLKVKFRSNEVELPEGKYAYFWKGALTGSFIFNAKKPRVKNKHHYLIGYIEESDKDRLRVFKYKVPEILLIEEEIRNVKDEEESIIC